MNDTSKFEITDPAMGSLSVSRSHFTLVWIAFKGPLHDWNTHHATLTATPAEGESVTVSLMGQRQNF